jgi:dTDP-4-dehydrorhamnose reductase
VKVAVTGAGGMLARALLPALAAAGHQTLALAKRDADVTRLDQLRRPLAGFRPDWVVHLAAFTRVDDCESRPDEAYLVNATGTRNAALAALECGASLLALSSDYVFDGTARRPYREYDAIGPRSVYGASKWAGEQAVREIQPRHLIVRSAWLYGAGGTNFVDTMLRKARAGESLRVVDDQRGSPTFTEDLAAGLVRLLASGQLGTFHCTNRGDCTWYELAAHALKRAGLSSPIARTDSATLARPAPRPAYSVLDTRWFEAATGMLLPPWTDAVDRYLGAPAPTRAT